MPPPNATSRHSAITLHQSRGLRHVLTAMFLAAGLAWANRSAVGQVPDAGQWEVAMAWFDGSDRVIDAMDLRRRYVRWIDYLVDDHIAQNPDVAPERDHLIAALRDSVPWSLVRAQHLILFGLGGLDVASDVEAPGVPLIVDQVVRFYESPLGTAALDLGFPPRDTLMPDDAEEQLEALLTPELTAEVEALSQTYAGEIMDGVHQVAQWAVWEPLLSAARAVFAVREDERGQNPSVVGPSDERERQRVQAWREGAEQVFDAMDLERRYGEWVDYLVENRIARDTSLAPHRDHLIATLRDSLPWDSVRVRHLAHLGRVASQLAPDVESSGVPPILDEVARYYGSPVGILMLDILFPPRNAVPPDAPWEQLDEEPRFPFSLDRRAEVETLSASFADQMTEQFFAVATSLWDDLREASRRVAFRLGNGPPR